MINQLVFSKNGQLKACGVCICCGPTKFITMKILSDDQIQNVTNVQRD